MKTLFKLIAYIFSGIAGLFVLLFLGIIFYAVWNAPEKKPNAALSALAVVKEDFNKINHAKTVCYSVIPQKYRNLEIYEKFKPLDQGDHTHWRWRTSHGYITCKVFKDKYHITSSWKL